MKRLFTLLATVVVLFHFSLTGTQASRENRALAASLWPNSLCARSEQVIFSCAVKREGSRQSTANKLASLCASRKLSKEEGYLQYRFGQPGKVELEYPNTRTGTQQLFTYTHYMRYQVDLTEIWFTVDNNQYQIFDTYNGEEKRVVSQEGVSVKLPDGVKDVTFVCRTKVKADYSMLADVLKVNE
ncbi:MAG TPA: hypothetical protein VLL54_03880 [Pyrinomonadaceae bacterium]|nr:hypothetical protein [Pyrinomonadaceae bacterium]